MRLSQTIRDTSFALAASLILLLVVGGWAPASSSTMTDPAADFLGCSEQLVGADAPVYYAIDLVTTRKIRGARRATGTGSLTYAHSPFGVAINNKGTYVYDIDIQLEKLDSKLDGDLVAWVTTTTLKDVRLIGVLDDSFHARGQVDFNKYLVVISLEPSGKKLGDKWSGPIVLRGMSRSGLMHTKAGHGPFQVETCASYGFS